MNLLTKYKIAIGGLLITALVIAFALGYFRQEIGPWSGFKGTYTCPTVEKVFWDRITIDENNKISLLGNKWSIEVGTVVPESTQNARIRISPDFFKAAGFDESLEAFLEGQGLEIKYTVTQRAGRKAFVRFCRKAE